MDLGPFFLVFSSLQLVVAGYLVVAVASWRGARFRPAPGHPFALVPTVAVALAVGATIAAMAALGDVEFSRWAGTGGLMLAALASVLVLLRQP